MMTEGVLALFLGIVALIPVLLIGATMMELLIREAPRRGKRPDDLSNQSSRLFVRVVTAGGWVISGTPREVVRRLSERERAPLPLFLTERRAENALRHW
ncbi:MAG: hypothetical protein WCP07_11585, partial [bacterium]